MQACAYRYVIVYGSQNTSAERYSIDIKADNILQDIKEAAAGGQKDGETASRASLAV